MSELGDAIERLELWARGEEFDELTAVIAAARERDALAAVIEEARMWNRQSGSVRLLHLEKVLSRTPADALVERDARIRAEVIDWFAHETFPYVVNKARAHFGLTKGADRG